MIFQCFVIFLWKKKLPLPMTRTNNPPIFDSLAYCVSSANDNGPSNTIEPYWFLGEGGGWPTLPLGLTHHNFFRTKIIFRQQLTIQANFKPIQFFWQTNPFGPETSLDQRKFFNQKVWVQKVLFQNFFLFNQYFCNK